MTRIATYAQLFALLGATRLPVAIAAQEAPRALVGCFALFHGGGTRVGAELFNASPAVRLTSARITEGLGRGSFLAQRLDSGGRSSPRREGDRVEPRWSVSTSGDTLAISFHDGFSGAHFFLAVGSASRDMLSGRTLVSWDFAPPSGAGPVFAVRIACPPTGAG